MSKMRPVFWRGLCFTLPYFATAAMTHAAAVPFDSATVTRVENNVTIGKARETRVVNRRPASLTDVVKADDYLLTETESRAELQFPDLSIVRVGQNSVFSFDAGSRTISLQKGAIIFFVPPGGSANVKTPSLTAAITGFIIKLTPNLIAVMSGTAHTPWGPLVAGEALEIINGEPRKFTFDPKGTDGVLDSWGPFFEIPEVEQHFNPIYQTPEEVRWWDIQDIAVLNPYVRPTGAKTPKPKDVPEDDEHQPPPPPPDPVDPGY